MKKDDYIDELNNYLRKRDKDSFLKRYSELMRNVSPSSEEYIDLKLVRITYELLFVGDFEKLLTDINQLEPIIFVSVSVEKKAKILVNKGIVLGRLKRYDEAIDVYSKSLGYCDRDDMAIYKIDILTNMGVIYYQKNDPRSALKCYLSAYELNKKFKCQVKLTTLLVNIGVIYLNFEEYGKANYYFELSLKTIPSSREYAKLIIYCNLIITSSFMGDVESARKFIDLVKSYVSNLSQADELSFHKALAIYHTNAKNYMQAIEEYHLVIGKLHGETYDQDKAGFMTAIGKMYLEMKEYEQCREMIEAIESIGKLEEFLAEDNDYLSLKLSYYISQQDYQNALKYSQKINKLQTKEYISLEKLFSEDLMSPVMKQRTNISLDAYDEKISELEDTNHELLEKEKLLIESLNELKNESKLREKFISIISHDVRAPIGNIVQLLEMLDEDDDPKERDDIIAEVIDGMKQAYSLTNELVDWAKEIIDVKQATLSFLNVKEIVAEIELLYKQQLQKKHIIIINNLKDEKIVFSHKISIKTCFRNIIQNAIKYSPAYSKIEINQSIEADFVTYSIKDYGKGIKQEDMNYLFDVSKVSTLGTNQESGIGIGLLLVKELIYKNQGKIRCDSVVGEGTTFYLTFPLNFNPNETAEFC